jgi:N-acetylglucosaminyldiphosphoundecaprenol N-acetyl-beta-D-mannosaminyltransferase
MGMEWAYRLLQEPGRMWKRYLRTNVLFSVMIARALVSRRVAPVPALTSSEVA